MVAGEWYAVKEQAELAGLKVGAPWRKAAIQMCCMEVLLQPSEEGCYTQSAGLKAEGRCWQGI